MNALCYSVNVAAVGETDASVSVCVRVNECSYNVACDCLHALMFVTVSAFIFVCECYCLLRCVCIHISSYVGLLPPIKNLVSVATRNNAGVHPRGSRLTRDNNKVLYG